MSFSQLDIRPRASRSLFILLTVLHALAVVVLFTIQIWFWLGLLLLIGVLISWYQACWGIILQKKPRSIKRIIFSKGHWQIVDGLGNNRNVCLLGKSYLSTLLIVLHFCDIETRRKRSLVLARDSLDQQTFRRLSVILRNSF